MKKIYVFAILFLLAGVLYSVSFGQQIKKLGNTITYDDLTNSKNSKVIGILEGTLNKQAWKGIANAEYNPDHSITLLGLNKTVAPVEQMEITFGFKGPGTYPIGKGMAVFYRLDSTNAIINQYESSGARSDKVIITSYNEKEHLVEGSLRFSAKSKNGSILFINKLFIVRVK